MFENAPKGYSGGNPASSGILRWLPAMVVFGVVGGFVALAWYAYHAGTQSVKDTDLLVVEADKTPIKEKPVDAGGMQFPNQDKTIFDTFAGNSAQPPKVERVLPKPEEPVTPVASNSEPAGWINDTLHKSPDAALNVNATKPEQVIPLAGDTAQAKQDIMVTVKPVTVEIPPATKLPQEFQVAQATPLQAGNQATSYVAKAPVATPAPVMPPVAPATVVAAPPKEDKKPEIKKEPAAKPAAPAEDDGTVKVQLGAYRSEKEALDTWSVMQKKHDDLLASAQPIVIKADLGAKGIYYRLRVGGFSDAAEAKAFCSKLTDAGQACIIPAAK